MMPAGALFDATLDICAPERLEIHRLWLKRSRFQSGPSRRPGTTGCSRWFQSELLSRDINAI